MKALNIITLILIIVGGLNWGLVGIAEFDLVAAIFGGTTLEPSVWSRVVYVLVGASAIWQLIPLVRSFTAGETHAESNAVPPRDRQSPP